MERLDIHIDGVTYNVPRRRFASGRIGFRLMAGAQVHGRKVWINAVVLDVEEVSPEERARKASRNRARRLAKKRLFKEVRR